MKNAGLLIAFTILSTLSTMAGALMTWSHVSALLTMNVTMTSDVLTSDMAAHWILSIVGVGATIISGWYALSTLALVTALLPTDHAWRHQVITSVENWGAPWVMRIATGSLTVGMVLTPTAGALPTYVPMNAAHHDESAAASTYSPIPSPTGQDVALPFTTPPPRDLTTHNTQEYVVVDGDSLWTIATYLLSQQRSSGGDPSIPITPAQASTADIAQAWKRLYENNIRTIGPDPSLIHPGQVLAIPNPLTS